LKGFFYLIKHNKLLFAFNINISLRLTEENKLKRFMEENEQHIYFEREKKSKELEVNKISYNFNFFKEKII
jgi:hypothetical protein